MQRKGITMKKAFIKLLFVVCLCAVFLKTGAMAGETPADGKSQKISLQASEESIRIVLETLARQAQYNIVIPEQVNMKISVSLQNVSLPEALDAVLIVNGLRYMLRKKTILVYPETQQKQMAETMPLIALTAKVFNLQYLPVTSITPLVEGLLSKNGRLMPISPPASETWTSSASYLANPMAGEGASPSDPKGARKASYRFMVVDHQENLDTIAELIQQVDQPTRQVYISTVIFEMNVSEEEQIGFRWAISGLASGSALPWNFPFGHQDIGEYSPHLDPDDDYYPDPRPGLFPNSPYSDFLFGQVNMTSSQLMFELNQMDTDFNLLSNPRLMVTDREEAVILVGERYPVLRSTISDQGTVTETFDRYEPIGVQLRVKPHIQDNQEVSLLIEPQVTSVGNVVMGTTGLSYPRISTRKIESRIRIKHGHSLIIAGLVSESETANVTGVPILSDIPLLGYLFRHTTKATEKVDLVVVVTPYIDEPPDFSAIEQELKKSGFRPTARTSVKGGKVIVDKPKAPKK